MKHWLKKPFENSFLHKIKKFLFLKVIYEKNIKKDYRD